MAPVPKAKVFSQSGLTRARGSLCCWDGARIAPPKPENRIMAKNKTNTAPQTDVAANVITELTTLSAHGVTVNVADITPAGIAYLLTYGFNKSLQDKVAGLAKEMKEAEHADDVIEEAIAKARHERAAAIVAGTIGTGSSGPRLVGRDRMIRDVAIEHLRVFAAGKGIKMPTKAAELDAMVAKWMTNEDRALRVTTEADRRIADQSATVDTSDLDDLI